MHAIRYRYIDISLLKDQTFILLSLSVMLMSAGCPYMLYFLPAYAISAGELIFNAKKIVEPFLF